MVIPTSALQEICTSCRDVSSNAIRVPCSHHYCLTCLEQFFELAIADQSVFPPRCCSEAISIVSVSFFLKPIVVQTFDKKKIEFETRDKVYCSSRRRSTFIPPSNIVKDIGTCPKCNVKTHTLCKSKAHAGKCSQDASIEEVMDLARDNYWQRCYRCWALVDSVDGCDQIAYFRISGSVYCNQTLILLELGVSMELIFATAVERSGKCRKNIFVNPNPLSSSLFRKLGLGHCCVYLHEFSVQTNLKFGI